jgi:hypothetical protein
MRGFYALFALEFLLAVADFATGAFFAAAATLLFFFDVVITSFSFFCGMCHLLLFSSCRDIRFLLV